MNELLMSLAATLQALLLAVSAPASVSSGQLAAVEQALQKLPLSAEVAHAPAQPARAAQSFDTINAQTMPAVVNILCTTRGSGTFNPISGSGVIIDPRGIILTNAHVAQYVLLQNHLERNSIQCSVRTGAPARALYTAEVLFMPEAWAREHAKDIKKETPVGTGEHDYALLAITGRTNGSALGSVNFPTVRTNLARAITMHGSPVLLAGYPAGFLGGAIIQRSLWPTSTIGKIKRLMTFRTGSVDVFGLGGSIVAQSGVSGGAVVNQFGELVGLITTSSLASTTDKRDLRAITLTHINESLQAHTGLSLSEFLSQDIATTLQKFKNEHAPELTNMYKAILR